MPDSFQQEIPPARVNIQLSVDKGGAQKKVELPLKMMVVGDFAQKRDGKRVMDKERLNIDKNNFSQIMGSMNLNLDMQVPNKVSSKGGDIKVNLKVNNMKSFEPTEVARQMPDLTKLLAARNLLKDLGSNLLDNRDFRKRLESIIQDKGSMEALVQELEKIAPLTDTSTN